MTNYKKTWRVADGGALLGTLDIISPWSGKITEAVVNTDTGEVIAAHGASCIPFSLVVAPGILESAEIAAEGYGDIIYEEPPYALTDAHVHELERAIRAEGYRIMIDPDCNIKLEKET